MGSLSQILFLARIDTSSRCRVDRAHLPSGDLRRESLTRAIHQTCPEPELATRTVLRRVELLNKSIHLVPLG